jgi:hypothetical protein
VAKDRSMDMKPGKCSLFNVQLSFVIGGELETRAISLLFLNDKWQLNIEQ